MKSCSDIGIDLQCFKSYNEVCNKTQAIGRKENNPLASKEDNWMISDCMDKKIVDVIRYNEFNIQSLLLRGIELYKIEEELSEKLFQNTVKIYVCNDNKLLYFIISNQLFIYSRKELSEGFIVELKNNYIYKCLESLEFGIIIKIQLNTELKCRLNLPQILLVNLHIIEKYPSYRMALGIADIAGYLRKYNLAKVDILDMQFSSIDDLYVRIDKGKYDYVGLSANFGHLELMNKLIEYIENKRNDIKIIVGNYLAATEYVALLNAYKNIIVCSNEGELTFAKLCWNYIKRKQTLENIPNIYFYDGKVIRFTYLEFIDMDDLSFPAIDTVEMLFSNDGVVTLEYSRGCNYGKCSFCPRKFKGNKWRGMSNKKMFELWKYYYVIFTQYNKKPYVYFVDEEFLGNCHIKENYLRIRNFFDIIDTENMKMNFDISCRVDQLVDNTRNLSWTIQQIEVFSLAKKIGLKRIFLGLESGSREQIKRYNKGIDISQAIASLRILSLMGFNLRLGFITFDPLMTRKDLLENIEILAREDIILSNRILTSELISNILADRFFVSKPYMHLYEAISYPVSPLELLRDCAYVENIRINYNFLVENIESIDNFGRFQCEYLDRDIKEICDFCQKWVNYNFPLIYTLKGLSKRHDDNEEKYIFLISTYRKITFYMFVTLSAFKNVIELNDLVKIIGLDAARNIIDSKSEYITIEKIIIFYETLFKEKIDDIINQLISYSENLDVLFKVYYEWKKQNILDTSTVRDL